MKTHTPTKMKSPARQTMSGANGNHATWPTPPERIVNNPFWLRQFTVAEYHQMVASTQAMRQEPIDEAYSDHDMWFADQADTAEMQLEKSQLTEMLSKNIACLPEREAIVLQLYFAEEMNLEEIGETLNVGAARICQIKKTALDRLRMTMVDVGDTADI